MAARLRNEEYANWVKCTKALKIVQTALVPFVEKTSETQYQKITSEFKNINKRKAKSKNSEACGSDTTAALHFTESQSPSACQQCVKLEDAKKCHQCDTWIRSIRNIAQNIVTWKNCNPLRWQHPDTGPFEIAKLFMASLGKRAPNIKSVAHCDVSEIVQLLQNNKFYQSEAEAGEAGVDCQKKCRTLLNGRENFFYSSAWKVNKEGLKKCTKVCRNVLLMPGVKRADEGLVTSALAELNQIMISAVQVAEEQEAIKMIVHEAANKLSLVLARKLEMVTAKHRDIQEIIAQTINQISSQLSDDTDHVEGEMDQEKESEDQIIKDFIGHIKDYHLHDDIRGIFKQNKRQFTKPWRSPIQTADELLPKECPEYKTLQEARNAFERCKIVIEYALANKCVTKLFHVLEEVEPSYAIEVFKILYLPTPLPGTKTRKTIATRIIIEEHYTHLLKCRNPDPLLKVLNYEMKDKDPINIPDETQKKMIRVLREVVNGSLYDFVKFKTCLEKTSADIAAKLKKENRFHTAFSKAIEEHPHIKQYILPNLAGVAHEIICNEDCIKWKLILEQFEDINIIQRAVEKREVNKKVMEQLSGYNVFDDVELHQSFNSNATSASGHVERDIHFAFCETQQTWFWSCDYLHWCHVSSPIWPFDDETKSINKESLETLQNLLYNPLPSERKDDCSKCIVCWRRHIGGPEAIEEASLKYIDVMLLLRFTEQKVTGFHNDRERQKPDLRFRGLGCLTKAKVVKDWKRPVDAAHVLYEEGHIEWKWLIDVQDKCPVREQAKTLVKYVKQVRCADVLLTVLQKIEPDFAEIFIKRLTDASNRQIAVHCEEIRRKRRNIDDLRFGSKKRTKILEDTIEDKDVQDVPGIGDVVAGMMKDDGYALASDLYNKFTRRSCDDDFVKFILSYNSHLGNALVVLETMYMLHRQKTHK